jgi:CelD/BcsL family acetyltransferase involved in cellulose biosynthesis
MPGNSGFSASRGRSTYPPTKLFEFKYPMTEIQLVTQQSQWSDLEKSWDELDDGVLTRGFRWLRSWWNSYGLTNDLRIFVAKKNGCTVGILPLMRKSCLFQGDTLCFLGSGRACSDRMGILSHPELADDIAVAFANHLLGTRSQLERWDHLDLDGVRADDLGMCNFAGRLADNPHVHWERRSSPSTWMIPLVDGFEGYLASISKRVRKMYRQAKNQLTQDCSFQVAQSKPEALMFLRDVERAHQSRWETAGELGCFAAREFHEFLCNAVESHWCDEPAARLDCSVVIVRALVAGTSGAGMIGFVRDGVLSVYVTGMKPQYADRRLGWFTNLLTIEYAAKIGCIGIDLMRGDETYKARLGARPIAQERWIISNPRWSSRALNAAYYAARNLKGWADSIRKSPPKSTPSNDSDAKKTDRNGDAF